jgi:hypothetical protein
VLFSAADGSSILADGPSVAWQKVAMTKFGQQDSTVMGVAKLGVQGRDGSQRDDRDAR